MNQNERLTHEKYAKSGVHLNKNGWPDFYYFSGGKLTVVETKAGNDDLTFEQQAIRDFLVSHGVRYILEYIKEGESITVFDSEIHANQNSLDQSTLFQPSPCRANPNHSTPDQSISGLASWRVKLLEIEAEVRRSR